MSKRVSLSATITVSGGSGTVTTTTELFYPMVHSGGKIVQVIVTPPDSSYKYDFYITNPNSHRIYEMQNRKGTANRGDNVDTKKGAHTFGIENASDDGDYDLELIFDAEW